jgi:predicted TIM-barrel fold metal-dependent hydrolase
MKEQDERAADRQIYQQELRAFLPPRIFDAHVHLFDATCLQPGATFPARNVYQKFGGVSPLETYLAWAAEHLPEQEIHLNAFGQPSHHSDRDASAAYSGRISDNRRFFGMALVSPKDSPEEVVRRVEANRLIGYKPYLNFVDWKPKKEITIEDMLPAAQMEAADARGLAVTLHIPREARLADPVNQVQMVALCRRYPNARVIVAHVGRAYWLANVQGFLDGIAACPNAYLDTAMVNHEGVLEYAFRNFPRERILFGSDAPIAFLKGKSVEINNQYAYLMGEDYAIGTSLYDAGQAVAFTSFFYEQLRGIRLAAERAGWANGDLANLFFNNADRLFRSVAERNYSV